MFFVLHSALNTDVVLYSSKVVIATHKGGHQRSNKDSGTNYVDYGIYYIADTPIEIVSPHWLPRHRALEVYGQHGVPLSDILKSQHASAGGVAAISGPARYDKTCIFWIQCDQRGGRQI